MTALVRLPHGLMRRYLSFLERLLVAAGLSALVFAVVSNIPVYPPNWDLVILATVFVVALWFPAAAYFIACEGLTNAVKHAHASRVVVSTAQQNGTLVVSVADDGVGGASRSAGSGLSGLADRVEAQGGALTLASDPGEGTTLTAELPCRS